MASENGWEPARANASQCNWVTVPGTNVTLQILKGQPTAVLRAAAADFNAYIEPLRDADSACYTPTNSVPTSNHLNGTACDWDWNSHPFRQRGSFTAEQVRTIREMQEFYTQDGLLLLFWAGDWSSPIDEMHWQMGYSTYGDPRVQKFIDTKIRPDGFSTFRRGGDVTSKADQYALAIIGEGQRRGITPRGIQIALSVALVESNLKMWANSTVPESLSIPHDAVGNDHDSLGLFQQRCPMWGPAHVLMDPAQSAGLFYDRLVRMDYNSDANRPGWYAAEVQRPAAEYRYRYDERIPEAAALYNRLVNLAAAPEEGFLMALSEAEQREALDLLRQQAGVQRESLSPLRHLGSTHRNTIAGYGWATDGNVHVLLTYLLAELGHPPTLSLLNDLANADLSRYPDRADGKNIAKAILTKIGMPSAPMTVVRQPEPEVLPYIPPPPTYVPPTPAPQPEPQKQVAAAPPPAMMPTEAPETGLLAEITSLTAQLRGVSETVSKIVQGSDEE